MWVNSFNCRKESTKQTSFPDVACECSRYFGHGKKWQSEKGLHSQATLGDLWTWLEEMDKQRWIHRSLTRSLFVLSCNTSCHAMLSNPGVLHDENAQKRLLHRLILESFNLIVFHAALFCPVSQCFFSPFQEHCMMRRKRLRSRLVGPLRSNFRKQLAQNRLLHSLILESFKVGSIAWSRKQKQKWKPL